MTDISIIIVSYKSADLLMLTLAAVRRASEGLKSETYVVDNNSQDGTIERVKQEAPWVNLIAQNSNDGFSRANNVALRLAKGRIILILNPDTVICCDTLKKIIAHFDENKLSGAIGVRMVNGEGIFLKESKRGYTTLSASFFKLSGLWKLAPSSPTLNAYYLGQYKENDVCQAPILSGACLAFSHDLLDSVGLFDEDYFMYSEDIDLSWRMNNASSGNVYRGDIPIIHFKGQSTPRSRFYINHFHKSMLLFAQKHEFPKHNALVNLITRLGISVAKLVALTRCYILRNKESHKSFTPPLHPVLVTNNPSLATTTTCATTTYANITAPQQTDALIFDIDGDIEKAINFMRANTKKFLFGFYNPDNQNALLFFNNRCHKINLTN